MSEYFLTYEFFYECMKEKGKEKSRAGVVFARSPVVNKYG